MRRIRQSSARKRAVLLVALAAAIGAVSATGYFVNGALAAGSPPQPTITSSPASPSTSTSASFKYSDSESGVTFSCSLDSASFSTCSSSGISYTVADGSHVFEVRAQSANSVSSAVTYKWSAQPPAPSINSKPANPTTSSSAAFTYTDTQAGTTFDCSINSAKYTSCPVSGVSYTGLSAGNNTFGVEAVSSGQLSAQATYAWSIAIPEPSITSGPANPTASKSAAFTYTDTVGGVSYLCSLNGAAFSTCKSTGISYSGLANGTQTFAVEATSATLKSVSATYTWVVDTTPPTVAFTFPANGGYYGASAWGTGCSPIGICGTASDPSGVSKVTVALLQASSSKFWNGSSFSSKTADYLPATGTTSWHLAVASRPSDGEYMAYVVATDALGNSNSSAPVTSSFMVLTTPPPAPTILSAPSSPTTSTSAMFVFADTELVQFKCSLNGAAYSSCLSVAVAVPGPGNTCNFAKTPSGPCTAGFVIYSNLQLGNQCFAVEAIDAAGNIGPATKSCWVITSTNGLPFTMTGTVTQLFYPGTTQSLNLSFTNPNGVPITVNSVSITVNAVTSKAGCNGPTNLTVSHSLIGSVTVPANSTDSLSQLGVSQADWPSLTMPNLPVNQDACAGAKFSLTYSGTATGS